MIDFLQVLAALIVLHLIANTGRRGPAPLDRKTGGRLVRPGTGIWLAGCALPIIGAIVLIALPWPGRSPIFPPLAAAVLTLLAAVTIWFGRVHFVFDDTAIRRRALGSRRERVLPWSEVTEAREDWSGHQVLVGRSGVRLRVEPRLRGFRTLVDELDRLLPAEVPREPIEKLEDVSV